MLQNSFYAISGTFYNLLNNTDLYLSFFILNYVFLGHNDSVEWGLTVTELDPSLFWDFFWKCLKILLNRRTTKLNWIPTFPKSYTFSASRWADAMYIKGEEKRKYYLSSLSPPKNSLRPKKKNWIQRTEAAEHQLGQKEVKKIYCNRPMTSNNSEASSAYWNLSVLIHVWGYS